VAKIAFSSDSNRLVCISGARANMQGTPDPPVETMIWDCRSLTRTHYYKEEFGCPVSMSFLPGDQELVIATAMGEVFQVDVDKKLSMLLFTVPHRLHYSLIPQAGGIFITAGYSGGIEFQNAKAGEITSHIPTDGPVIITSQSLATNVLGAIVGFHQVRFWFLR
jgi:hypothetical protein